jgi:hypothetical protein
MFRCALVLFAAVSCSAAPRVDNVLEKMTPPDASAVVGARMDALRGTDLYRRLIEAGKLPQLDAFAKETGFDPRTDVRELLLVTTPKGRVLLARGTFHVNAEATRGVPRTRHGGYQILGQPTGAFCILDETLAAAGDTAAIEEALDEWVSGSHTAARGLLGRVAGASENAQIWGISTGVADFLADNVPTTGGVDFSKIFHGMQDVWFEGNLSNGLRAEVHGSAATEEDAMHLRDAVRGLVGMGRLSVPEKQPELLRLWDGIVATQTGKAIAIRMDIAADLMEKLVAMLSSQRPGDDGTRRSRNLKGRI